MVEVRVLGPADAPAAVAVLARAFDQEPAKLAMLPDGKARRIVLEIAVGARLRETLRYGTAHGAYVNGELGAVALWYPPGAPMLSMGGALRMAAGRQPPSVGPMSAAVSEAPTPLPADATATDWHARDGAACAGVSD
jgi:hypothetical protein